MTRCEPVLQRCLSWLPRRWMAPAQLPCPVPLSVLHLMLQSHFLADLVSRLLVVVDEITFFSSVGWKESWWKFSRCKSASTLSWATWTKVMLLIKRVIVFKASLAQPPDISSFGFDFNVAARWRLHRSRYMLWGAREAPGSLSLRVGRVRLELVSASIGVCVVLWQRRRVLARQRRVWRNQTFLHPFLLLHPSVLEPNFDLKIVCCVNWELFPRWWWVVRTYLRLVQLERCCNFNPPGPGEIFVEVKFFLQFCQLFGGEVRPAGVVDASALSTVETVRFWCWNIQKSFSCCRQRKHRKNQRGKSVVYFWKFD